MSLRLLFLFVVVPIVELALLIEIGRGIGFWPTMGLILFTGVLGSSLAKQQGLAIWLQFNEKMNSGQLPGKELLDGFIVLISGALLLTPGVITDFVGFLGLIPFTRKAIRNYVQKRLEKSQATGRVRMHFGFSQSTTPPSPPPRDADPQWQGKPKTRPDYAE